jgi:hypothetical protein
MKIRAHEETSDEVGRLWVEAFGEGIVEVLDLLPCQILG